MQRMAFICPISSPLRANETEYNLVLQKLNKSYKKKENIPILLTILQLYFPFQSLISDMIDGISE